MADEPIPQSPEPVPPEPAAAGDPTDDELVDEMELESFPASDPPSRWAGPPTE